MTSATEEIGSAQLRRMLVEMSLLSNPDGSAMFNQGDTTVIAAVYGPREVRMNREQTDRATVDVIYRPKVGLPGNADRFNQKFICSTCEDMIILTDHPRTSIDVIIQEVQNCGSHLACCINATCLALMDACIPMKYSVAAVSCVLDSEGKLHIDPSSKQEVESNIAQMTFVFDSIHYNVVACFAQGTYTSQQYHTCLIACQKFCSEIVSFFRDSVAKKSL